MDFSRLVVYLQQVEEDKKKDREEQKSKRAKSAGHEHEQEQNKGSRSFFQKRSSNLAPSSASAPVQHNRYDQKSQSHQNSRAQGSQSQASVTKGYKGKPSCD